MENVLREPVELTELELDAVAGGGHGSVIGSFNFGSFNGNGSFDGNGNGNGSGNFVWGSSANGNGNGSLDGNISIG